ncbi:MAG: acyl-CoA dehydrogenase family protein [Alphaproteobacteria bacterium]
MDTETRKIFLSGLRQFVTDRLIPFEAEVDDAKAVPERILAEMRDMGLFGLSIPDEYGGLGLTVEEEVLTLFEMGHAAMSFRGQLGTNNGLGSHGLMHFGTDVQKQSYLPRLAAGEKSCFALTEANAGSDAAALQTRAIRDGDSWIVNGEKRYISHAPDAKFIVLMARTGGEGSRGISAFFIDRDQSSGITAGKAESKLGLAGQPTADLIFTDARIPADSILGEEGMGFRIAMATLNHARLQVAASATGNAERLIGECVRYASERKQFGKPIAEFQLIQAMLADSRTECDASRALTLDVARAADRGEKISRQAASAKLYASEMVGRVADRAVQIFGGAGYMTAYGIERFYRDTRIYRLYEGTSEIQRLIIAREMIKEDSEAS